jgi:hypothetical protein
MMVGLTICTLPQIFWDDQIKEGEMAAWERGEIYTKFSRRF